MKTFKRNIILLLIFFSTLKGANAQHLNIRTTFNLMKDYIGASIEMKNNHKDGVVAKNIKVYYGKNTSEIEYYTFIYDFSTEQPYYCVLDTALMDFYKVNKKNLYEVNIGTRELTQLKHNNGIYKSFRGTLEAQHKAINYFIYNNKNLMPETNYALYKKTDTIIRTIPCLIFYSWNLNEKHRKEAVYYINKNNYELDSVLWISTRKDGSIFIAKKEIINEIENFNMNEIRDIFDFNSQRYIEFSKHDNKNIPYSFNYSENENFSIPQVIKFELKDLNNRKTSLENEKGWVLLDIWEFGCRGCYEGFKRMGKQMDSIGQTVLEKNGVKVICVNPTSDNMEFIKKVADKYKVQKLLYAGKGLTEIIAIPSYPTYYLISPKKEVVKKGTQFNDTEILEAIRCYNNKD